MSFSFTRSSIFIIGCGDVGNRLAARLLHKGHKVWGLRRNIMQLAPGVIPVKGDLKNEATLGEWPDEPIHYIVYCTAATDHSETGYRQAYLEGMQHVLTRLKACNYPVRRLFFTSSTGVYHQLSGEWVDENSATSPESMTGKIMLNAEKLAASTDVPATVVRFSGIYGPGREYLINRVKKGEGYTDTPAVYGNRIHAEDCAGMLEYLIEYDLTGRVVESCYIGVDQCPAPLHEVTDWLACQLNVTLSNFIEVKGRGSKRCSGRKVREMGYRFLFQDYKAGYKLLLRE